MEYLHCGSLGGKLLKDLELKSVTERHDWNFKRENIQFLFEKLIPEFPEVEFGAHLHTTPQAWEEKVDAAFKAGCRRFDSAIKGYGGCPMAEDQLTGNMPTENLLLYLKSTDATESIDFSMFDKAVDYSSKVFVTA